MESKMWQWVKENGWEPLTEEAEKDLVLKIWSHNQLLKKLESEKREPDRREQKIIRDGKAALNSLVEHMIPLGIKIASEYTEKYPGAFLTFEDFFQEACLGIMHAVELYSVEKGARFSTYATYWIEQHIRRAIEDKGDLIRKPASAHSRLRMIRKCGNSTSAEDISNKVGINVNEVKFLQDIENTYIVSLDQEHMGMKVPESYSEKLKDPTDYREIAEENVAREQIRGIIHSMKDKKQRTVMEMHLGYTRNNICYSNRQISKALGINPSEVNSVITKTRMELVLWGRPKIGLR